MSKKSHNRSRGIGFGIKYLKDIKYGDVLAFLVVHMERYFFFWLKMWGCVCVCVCVCVCMCVYACVCVHKEASGDIENLVSSLPNCLYLFHEALGKGRINCWK